MPRSRIALRQRASARTTASACANSLMETAGWTPGRSTHEISFWVFRSTTASNSRLAPRLYTFANASRLNGSPGSQATTSAFGGSLSVTIGKNEPAGYLFDASITSSVVRISAAVSGSSGPSLPAAAPACGAAHTPERARTLASRAAAPGRRHARRCTRLVIRVPPWFRLTPNCAGGPAADGGPARWGGIG